jgi:hypothetical protein
VVAALRRSAGWSAAGLGRRIGVSRWTVRRWESPAPPGRPRPACRRMENVFHSPGCSLTRLRGRATVPGITDIRVRRDAADGARPVPTPVSRVPVSTAAGKMRGGRADSDPVDARGVARVAPEAPCPGHRAPGGTVAGRVAEQMRRLPMMLLGPSLCRRSPTGPARSVARARTRTPSCTSSRARRSAPATSSAGRARCGKMVYCEWPLGKDLAGAQVMAPGRARSGYERLSGCRRGVHQRSASSGIWFVTGTSVRCCRRRWSARPPPWARPSCSGTPPSTPDRQYRALRPRSSI